jgi:hypothetical protein
MHWRTATGSTADELHFQEATRKVEEFFTLPTTISGTPRAIVDFLGPAVTRGPGALEIRAYHLGDPEPREVYTRTADISGTPAANALPAEVATCLSFSGSRPGLPRERGRIYLGPLTNGVLEVDEATGRTKVTALWMNLCTAKALTIAGGTDSEPVRWVVYSPTNNTSVIVRQGYMDDAFDTQRRRGEDAVGRTSFTVPA